MKNKVIIKIYQKNLRSKLENLNYYLRINKWKLKVKINRYILWMIELISMNLKYKQ